MVLEWVVSKPDASSASHNWRATLPHIGLIVLILDAIDATKACFTSTDIRGLRKRLWASAISPMMSAMDAILGVDCSKTQTRDNARDLVEQNDGMFEPVHQRAQVHIYARRQGTYKLANSACAEHVAGKPFDCKYTL